MKSIAYDAETTGIPEWKIPSDDPIQPHIVQLAWITPHPTIADVCESEVRVVKPEGWTIPPDMTAIHGISQEFASDVGLPEKDVAEEFIEAWRKTDIRIGHNESFDARIIRIALKRFRPDLCDEWKGGLAFCTMIQSKKHLAGLPAHKKPERNTLACVYRHYTGLDLEDAHNAMCDAAASMAIYQAIMRGGK